MIDTENVCGNCKYNKYDYTTEEFTCDCEESAYYGLETYYEDSCDVFEEKWTFEILKSRTRTENLRTNSENPKAAY